MRQLISVIFPVYNAEIYVLEAAKSILGQTDTEFELIVVDDGSTDSSIQLVESLKDSRIRIYSTAHRGIVSALNFGIEQSSGEYIARMDADDVSHHDRFMIQRKLLEEHPEIQLVGTWFREFSDSASRFKQTLQRDDQIKRSIFIGNRFVHGSVMFRRSILLKSGVYRPALFPAEDYDLWLRISENGVVVNIPRYLYEWRRSDSQISEEKRHMVIPRTRLAAFYAAQRALRGCDELDHSLDTGGNPAATSALLGYAKAALYLGHVHLARSLCARVASISTEHGSERMLWLRCIASVESARGMSLPLRRLIRTLL